MATRKPFIGLLNIIRFNLQFYVVVLILLGILMIPIWPNEWQLYLQITANLGFTSLFISLIVSTWIYDFSGLYDFNFITNSNQKHKIANIHAGFDETSEILKSKFPASAFSIFDFYNPKKHTEPSIKKARKLYPNLAETISIDTEHIATESEYYDVIFLIFAAHEIREFKEIKGELSTAFNKALKDTQSQLSEDRPGEAPYKKYMDKLLGATPGSEKTTTAAAAAQAGMNTKQKELAEQAIKNTTATGTQTTSTIKL